MQDLLPNSDRESVSEDFLEGGNADDVVQEVLNDAQLVDWSAIEEEGLTRTTISQLIPARSMNADEKITTLY